MSSHHVHMHTELADEIRKETQKYFRHSQKNAGQPSLPAKDAAIPETVNALYMEVDLLAAEKIALAARLVKLLERAMARLQHDLQKILKLQGEEPGLPPTQHFLNNVDTTVQQLQTSLRNAVAAAVSPPPAAPPAAPPPQKSTYLFTHCSLWPHGDCVALRNGLLSVSTLRVLCYRDRRTVVIPCLARIVMA